MSTAPQFAITVGLSWATFIAILAIGQHLGVF